MILKSETYHFHRLELTRQAGLVVTVHDEQGLPFDRLSDFFRIR